MTHLTSIQSTYHAAVMLIIVSIRKTVLRFVVASTRHTGERETHPQREREKEWTKQKKNCYW